MTYDEYRHPFVGWHGTPAVCHIRIYRPNGRFVVVCSELPSNPGTSVTNAAEWVSSDIWGQEGQPARDRWVWVEHYPPLPADALIPRRTPAGDFDLVTFQPVPGQEVFLGGRTRTQWFRQPHWAHLELAEVEALIGEPWTPISLGEDGRRDV